MRSNDRVSINLGPARYDSEKAIRRQIDDAQSEATTDAIDAIVNNPNLNLAGGGAAPATPATPATGPKYTAPNLATDFPVDGLVLTAPISNTLTDRGARALNGSIIYSRDRSFNAATGVSTTFTGPSVSNTASNIVYFRGFIYIEGARWSAATGAQYLNTTTLAWTAGSTPNVAVIGISGNYLWLRNGNNGNIYAVDDGGNTTLAYSGTALGVIAQNDRIAFYVGGGTNGIYNTTATLPLSLGTATSGLTLTTNSNQKMGLDTSGNIYYLTVFDGALQLNVRDLLGTTTLYPYVFSTSGDPLDGEPAQRWDEAMLSFETGYNYLQVTAAGRILVGAGAAGAYLGADNTDWPYPAIYEISIEESEYGSQIIHVSPEFIPDYGTGTWTGARASSQGPVAQEDGSYTWSDMIVSSYTGGSGSTTIKYDIYKASL